MSDAALLVYFAPPRTSLNLSEILEIEEENELVMFDDIFDESQSGIMPFWLKSTRSVLLPPLATLSRVYHGCLGGLNKGL